MKKAFDFVRRYWVWFLLGLPFLAVGVWLLFFKGGDKTYSGFVASHVDPNPNPSGVSDSGLAAKADLLQKCMDGLGGGYSTVIDELQGLTVSELQRLYNIYGRRLNSAFYLGSVPIIGRLSVADHSIDLVTTLKKEFGANDEALFGIWAKTGLW